MMKGGGGFLPKGARLCKRNFRVENKCADSTLEFLIPAKNETPRLEKIIEHENKGRLSKRTMESLESSILSSRGIPGKVEPKMICESRHGFLDRRKPRSGWCNPRANNGDTKGIVVQRDSTPCKEQLSVGSMRRVRRKEEGR